eukprot:497363_1
MFTSLVQPLYATRDEFNNLNTQQKHTILAIGVSAISLLTASYYWSSQKRKTWEKRQEPILSQYWSDTYHIARQKFRESCAKIKNCKTHSISVDPMEDLTVDLCYIPSTKPTTKPPHLLIHISGTHGVEGFAGSAIQNQLLEQIATKDHTDMECDVLFVHALNAFGMCHNRRFNRYNVDLNRNTFLNKREWKKIKARHPNMFGYESLSSVINPDYTPSYPWTDIAVWMRMLGAIIRSGSIGAAGRAIVNGQYHKATGLFYGGFHLQNEPKNLFKFIINECKTEWNVDLVGLMKGNNSKLTIVDVHTGIGPKGVDSLYISTNKEMQKLTAVKGLPKEYFDDKKRLQNKQSGGKYAQVYKYSVGGVPDGLCKLLMNVNRFVDSGYDSDKDGDKRLDDRLDCVAITEEFGTVASTSVVHALVMENAIYNLHLMDEESLRVLQFRQQRLRDVFYLNQDVQWKYDVLRRGVALFHCLSTR